MLILNKKGFFLDILHRNILVLTNVNQRLSKWPLHMSHVNNRNRLIGLDIFNYQINYARYSVKRKSTYYDKNRAAGDPEILNP